MILLNNKKKQIAKPAICFFVIWAGIEWQVYFPDDFLPIDPVAFAWCVVP